MGTQSPEPLSVCDERLDCQSPLTEGAAFESPSCVWRELWWRGTDPPPPKKRRRQESSSKPEPMEIDSEESDVNMEPMEVDLPPEEEQMEVDPSPSRLGIHYKIMIARRRRRIRERRSRGSRFSSGR